MDYKAILKVLSIIGITIGLIFLTDTIVGLIFNEDVLKLIIFNIIFFTINLLIWLYLKDYKLNLRIKDSIVLVNLLWILLGIGGAIPYMLYAKVSFANAFFEAISGFTTTGATIFNDIESLPHFILFHRSLTHFLGGLGVIVLGVGLLSIINPSGSLSLFRAESTGIELEKFTPKIKDTAFNLWKIYLLLTFIDFVLLVIFGMDWFDGINCAFSTISTGGFFTKNNSLGFYANNDGIIWTTTIFMILSGINFLAYLRLIYTKNFNGFKTQEVKWYLSIIIFLSLFLSIIHTKFAGDSFYDAMKHSFFTIASVVTTTGFATIDYGTWSHFAMAIIFIGMIIGGNAGSTAGGIKVIRHIIVFKTLFVEFKKTIHPNMISGIFVDNIRQKGKIITSVFGFVVLFMITVGIVTIYIYARGYDAMSAISGGFAIVGNVGPGFSLVGPSENFSFFNDFDKMFLSFGMIIGRLECYTVYILLSSSFWKKF